MKIAVDGENMRLPHIIGIWLVLQLTVQAWLLWGPSFPDLTDFTSSEPLIARRAAVDGPLSVFIALQKTDAARASNSESAIAHYRAAGAGEGPVLRRLEDRYFRHRAKQLAERLIERQYPAPEPLVFVVKTGDELLEALASASRRGEITNVVVYGHSGPDGLYMLEDAGFYTDLDKTVAEPGRTASQTDTATIRRQSGARDVSDLIEAVRSGKIHLSADAVFLLAGCNAAGEFRFDHTSIASELARATHARVIASVGRTLSWSNFGGPEYAEYSLAHWSEVRFGEGIKRFDGRGLDPMKHLKLRAIR